ncbi:MAG TPA: iron-sulfur cluster-binding domain-containing protein [Tissierellia bacterium]|jgi:ferredoxin-NADP reductase|nr:iron-sulfur cluster-binding domain-containing protein [Tissierellia bacterium]
MTTYLNSLDLMKFTKLIPERKAAFAAAPATPLPKDYAVNALARSLHPNRQYLTVTAVTELGPDCKSFELCPDLSRGTSECAYFSAGQYLTVFLDIEGIKTARAYSISSSPKESLEGKYRLTIKYVEDGLASRYILDNWTVGTPVEVSGPAGNFDYQPLRDAKTVVGLAGGSGITPFISMAKAIADGDEDFEMILLYGSQTEDTILFKDELDELTNKCNKIKVVHVLSNEKREGYEYGFITADIIRKYAPSHEYSVFMCGPQEMYRFLDRELEKLNLERKYIRRELFGEFYNPQSEDDYPADVPNNIKITVSIMGEKQVVSGNSNDSILQTLERNGISAPSRCRSGECGWCHSYLISGKVYTPKHLEGRRLADFKYGYVHPCCSFPLTDIEIEVPPVK